MGSTLKRMPAGLYSHGAPPPAEYHDAYSGGFVNVPWRLIEPTKGTFLRDAIDAAAKPFRDAGYRDGRLRVLMGASAPDWAHAEYGTVLVRDAFQTSYHAIIPFWESPGYLLHYDAFMRWINNHVCAPDDFWIEVSMSACMSVFAEPFNRNIGDATSRSNMLAAGYTFAKDHAAMAQMAQLHANRFGRTRSGLACNPWGNPETGKLDVAATLNFIDYARSLMGAKCILENNSLDAPADKPAPYIQMYDYMKGSGKPIAFQTEANDRLKDPAGMIDYACQLGASAVETEVHPPFTSQDAFLYAEQLKSQVRKG